MFDAGAPAQHQPPDAPSAVGSELELEIGGPAQGGACVARHGGANGRVVFVRHALPGELVRAVVTEDRGGSFLRADAVEILRASTDRVSAPCPHAGPGKCGGCDWQHAGAPAQRALKETVVRDQFTRLGGIELGDLLAGVEELPGGPLGWRTRISFAVGRDGRPGLHRHASHEIEHIDRCLLGVDGVGDSAVLASTWPGCNGVEVVRGDDGELAELTHRAMRQGGRGRGRGRPAHGRRAPDRVGLHAGPQTVRREVGGRDFTVWAGGFWQAHPAAAGLYASAVLEALRAGSSSDPLRDATVLDLYAGAGALTAALAGAVGPDGRVCGLELDRRATDDANANLADLPQATVRQGRVSAESVAGLGAEFGGVDAVVLDPPRAGAGADVLGALVALRPRTIAYLSCDAATLARDVAAAYTLGWRLESLRAFDAFPMTAHVECLAVLRDPRHSGGQPDTAEPAP